MMISMMMMMMMIGRQMFHFEAAGFKGLFIYYVIQLGGLGRPPPHVIL